VSTLSLTILTPIVVANLEQVFIYCAMTFSFVFIINQICSEKEQGLRGYMKIIGLRVRYYNTFTNVTLGPCLLGDMVC
jgi:hypothetical protein